MEKPTYLTQSQESSFDRRYQKIDEKNQTSWYMTDKDRPFDVNQSIATAGPPRQPLPESQYESERVRMTNRATRTLAGLILGEGGRIQLAGNMSSIRRADGAVPYGPTYLTDEERYEDALFNMNRYFNQMGVDPSRVRILNPNRDYRTSLTIVNVDEDPAEYNGTEPVRLSTPGDFVYTRNPNLVLGVRPADCPLVIMSGKTPEGPIGIMVHYAWRGAASGQYEQTRQALEQLEVDTHSINAYITGGGHAENFAFTDFRYIPDDNNPMPVEGPLFSSIEYQENEQGVRAYNFRIDPPYATYEALKEWGLEDQQIFMDTTDTTSLEAGSASHSRSVILNDDNMRDMVTVSFHWS